MMSVAHFILVTFFPAILQFGQAFGQWRPFEYPLNIIPRPPWIYHWNPFVIPYVRQMPGPVPMASVAMKEPVPMESPMAIVGHPGYEKGPVVNQQAFRSVSDN